MSFPFLGVPAVREQNPITLKVKLWNENNCKSKIENSKWSRIAHLALPREHKYPATLLGSRWLGNWAAKTTWKWQTVATAKSRKCLSVCNHFIFWRRWDVSVHGCFSYSLSASKTKEWKDTGYRGTLTGGSDWMMPTFLGPVLHSVLIWIQDGTKQYRVSNEFNCSYLWTYKLKLK